MYDNFFYRFRIVLLLSTLLILVVGCSSMSANNKRSGTFVSNVPLKMERIMANHDNTTSETQAANNVFGYRNGDTYLTKYQNVAVVKQIILVEQSAAEVSVGRLYVLTKNQQGDWQEFLQCKAYLGKKGLDKSREGDVRTPTGDFGMTMAFGAKDDPGSLVPYTKLTNTMYLCGDREYYNQFIDVSKVNHTCSANSEHLLSYIPQYNYALIFDYNKENVFGKGSAIFLHCFGNYPFTLGCVSVAEDNMVKILRTVDTNARICIYPGK